MSVVGEEARIARLLRILAERGAPAPSGLVLPNGDDAAVLQLGMTALSVDTAIEGVHFERHFAPLEDLAGRAVHAAASDLAAMLATPRCALVALTLSSGLAEADFDALVSGIAHASRVLGMPIVGGNLARGGALSITTTVIGDVVRPVERRGAAPGEGVFVTGVPGTAAIGLEAHLRRAPLSPDPWVGAKARVDLVGALRDVATSAIDLSDGLSLDLHRLLSASGVGATLVAESLVAGLLEGPNTDAIVALGLDPLTLALEGGEDYELCFTARAETLPFARRIGTIDAARGLRLEDASGVRDVSPRGFDHFANDQS